MYTFPHFSVRLKYYSKQEADFERSWALFVDYLAPPLFPTTLIRTYEFQKELPKRMLMNEDRAPFICDFSGFQNTVLFALSVLHKVHKYTGKRHRDLLFVSSIHCVDFIGNERRWNHKLLQQTV